MTVAFRWIADADRSRLTMVLIIYFMMLMVLRMVLFPGGSEDDAEILYYTQSWALTYKTGQPPLYAWVLMAVEAVLGPSMGAVVGLKYLLLALFYVFAYLAARRLFVDGLYAALTPLALIACFFIGWETVVNYSHTVLLLTAMAATLWLTLRLETEDGWAAYLWLGLAVAVGLLAKYNFSLFLLPMLAASWRHSGLRAKVFRPRFALVLTAAIALAVSPQAGSLFDGQSVAGATAAGRLFPLADNRLSAAGSGLGQFVLATLGLVSPFLPLAVGFFPRALAPLPHPARPLIDAGRFLEAYMLALVVVAVAAILISGAGDVRNNWLVVWFPLPMYLLLRIKVFADAHGFALEKRLAWFATVLVVVALAVPVGLAARGLVGPQTCRKCNFFIPYADLARSLAMAGFTTGAIVAEDRPNQLAGNLRRHFPWARVVSTRWRDYQPPMTGEAGGKCLLIWQGGVSEGGPVRQLAEDLRGGIPVPKSTIFRRVTLPIPRNPEHFKSWSYVVLDGAGNCR